MLSRFASEPKPRSTRTHLLALTVWLIAPAVLFATIILILFAESERGRIEQRAQGLARDIASDIDRQISARRAALEALATSEALAMGNLEAFQRQVEHTAQALGHRIALWDPATGRQVFNTVFSNSTQPPVAVEALSEIERGVASGKRPAVSRVFFAPLTRTWITVIMIPVIRDGTVVHILQSAIPSRELSDLLRSTELDEGWVSVILDQQHFVVARSSQDDLLVGRPISPKWHEENQGNTGIWHGRDLNDIPVIAASGRMVAAPWVVAVTVPKSIFNTLLMRALWGIAGFGLAMTALALLSAYVIGARLTDAIGSLTRTKVSIDGDRQPSFVRTPVTEINQVGEVLAAAEAQLQSIFRTVPDAMIVISEKGGVETMSTNAETLFGYEASELAGRNVDVLFNESARRFLAECRLFENNGSQFVGRGVQLAGRRKDGTTFPMELAAGAVRANGQHLVTLFVRDLSPRDKLERGLRRAQKMEAIGQLTGGIAHDFSNLLTVIISNLEMWEDEPGAGPEHLALIRQAQEAALISSQLTAQLLAFGRRQPLAPRVVDIGAFVDTISILIGRTLGDAIKTRTRVIGGDLLVFVDSQMLQNALLNLAINARDAMPEGGELTITASEEGGYCQEAGALAGRYVVISVADTGSGMTQEVQQRAFEPFFTTKPVGAGTGLGLSMVYGFVKQSSGEIRIDSEPGRGTKISICLPRIESDQGRPASVPYAETTHPRGHGETILVVEDDERVRRITTKRLRRLGYKVVEAENGLSALALVEAGVEIDLLFTDIVMPGGLSGDELAAKVREVLPTVNVLYTSGYADPAIAKRQIHVGATWLKKPYTMSELARAMEQLLNRSYEHA